MSAAPPTPSPAPDRPPDRSDLARALELAPAYDRPGPRYTSYPPAPHFVESVDGDVAREVYGARGPDAPPLSLYAHLPFCESMCTYCGCNVVISRDHAIVGRYLAGLEKDIALAAKSLSNGPKDVAQFHLGRRDADVLLARRTRAPPRDSCRSTSASFRAPSSPSRPTRA